MKKPGRHSVVLPLSNTSTLQPAEEVDIVHCQKRWQHLISHWSSPELRSLSSSSSTASVVTQHEKICWEEDEDEENISASASSPEKAKEQALVLLCKSLMLYGAPCHRIEETLEHVSKSLLLSATFIFIPGIMMITFHGTLPQREEPTNTKQCHCHSSQTTLVRCPQGFDMGKLTQVNEIVKSMCVLPTEKEHVSVLQSISLLHGVNKSKPTWSRWITLLSYTTSSLLTAFVMFNGTLLDTALSGCLGLLVGLLILLSERYPSYCNILEVSTTVLIAFIAKALDKWVCFTGVVLSATSILIPGYTLTMSIMELSARHIITGTVRFVYAMIYAVFIGYGLEIGTSIYEAIDPLTSPSNFDICKGQFPHWATLCLFPLLAVSMSINLGATVRQWPSMVCCSAVGFGLSVLLSKVIGNFQIVGTLSAFSVGLFGNIYSKITGELALIPLACGIATLVPGSIGIQGAYFLIRQDDQGVSFATQMVVASLGISVGLFAATLAVVSAKERKRTAYLSY